MKQIEFERWEPDAENPRKLNYAGQRAAEDVFHELEAQLDSVGYLPDEYLLLDRRWRSSVSGWDRRQRAKKSSCAV